MEILCGRCQEPYPDWPNPCPCGSGLPHCVSHGDHEGAQCPVCATMTPQEHERSILTSNLKSAREHASSLATQLRKAGGAQRPGWDTYFMILADAVSLRMSCDRARIGAVIVSADKRVLATGYGGAPSGWPSCDEVGHELVEINGRQSCVRTVHAEENAIVTAARHGVALDGATLYTTASTCYDCARMAVQAGIRRIVFGAVYTSARSGGQDIVALLKERGIAMDHVPLAKRIES